MAQAHVIIILGSELLPNGELGADSKKRAEHGVKLFQRGKADNLLMTGGHMRKEVNFSLAEAMKSYAISLGVPRERISREESSMDTVENALNSEKIARENGWKKLILVTSDYHMKRALCIFKIVFGKQYKISASEAKTNFSAKEHKMHKRAEELLVSELAFLIKFHSGNREKIIKALKKGSKYRHFLHRFKRKFKGQNF